MRRSLCVLGSLSFAVIASSGAGLGGCGGSSEGAAARSVSPSAVASSPAPEPSPVSSGRSPGASRPDYPPTTKSPVVDLYRDVKVSDDYRWLEDWNDPNVKSWSESENQLARKWLDAIPQRAAIHARVEQLLDASSPAWAGLVARHGLFFALESRPPKQHPSLVLLTSLGDLATERVLVDPNALDPTGGTAIGWFVPAPDGKHVAVSLSKGGGERGDVHVFETGASGPAKDGPDVVPQADGAGNGDCLAWRGDGGGFYYTHGAREADAPKDGVYQRVYFHKLGDRVDRDALAVGKDGPSIAQWELSLGGDGKTIVARMEYGDGGEFDQWILVSSGRSLAPGGKWAEIATKADHVKKVDVGPDGALYALSTDGAPKGKLLRSSLASAALGLGKAPVLVPEGDAVIDDFLATKGRVYLVEQIGGPSRVRSVPLGAPASPNAKPGAPQVVPTPAVSNVREVARLDGDDAAISITSYTERTAWYRVSAKDGSATKTALASTTPAGFQEIDVAREECVSKDGTKVPSAPCSPGLRSGGTALPCSLVRYGDFSALRPRPLSRAPSAWLPGFQEDPRRGLNDAAAASSERSGTTPES